MKSQEQNLKTLKLHLPTKPIATWHQSSEGWGLMSRTPSLTKGKAGGREQRRSSIHQNHLRPQTGIDKADRILKIMQHLGAKGLLSKDAVAGSLSEDEYYHSAILNEIDKIPLKLKPDHVIRKLVDEASEKDDRRVTLLTTIKRKPTGAVGITGYEPTAPGPKPNGL